MAELLNQFLAIVQTLFPVALPVAMLSVVLRARRAAFGAAVCAAIADAALAYSALAIAYLVFSPQPQAPTTVALIPGSDLFWALQADPGDVLPWAELAGNGVLLLPLGALIPLRVRWLDSVLKVMLAGLAVSCAIELIQYLAITGRTSSADDVILNTVGAALGGALSRSPARVAVPAPAGRAAYTRYHDDAPGSDARLENSWHLSAGERVSQR